VVATDHRLELTTGSTVDNLRPAIPRWDANHTAVFWMRGTYRHQSDFDQALVGLIRKPVEVTNKATYIDLTPETVTGHAAAWVYRDDYGNAGTAFECQSGSGPAPAPLAAAFTAPTAATYDVFAWFWSHPGQDWRLAAGLAPDRLRVFRRSNCQQVAARAFAGEALTAEGDRSLYQAYLGRRTLGQSEALTLHFAPAPGAGEGPNTRTSLDGLGYRAVR
jgi:hypothetical protein